MNVSVTYILDRLKEPSTWAAIAVFVGMFGISGDTLARITSNAPAVITAIATLIAIFAPAARKTTLIVPNGTVTSESTVTTVVSSLPAETEEDPARVGGS